MFGALDRCRRDSTLFQFTTKQLRDFTEPNHLLIQTPAMKIHDSSIFLSSWDARKQITA